MPIPQSNLTVENTDVDAIFAALKSGKIGQMDIVDIVSALFSKHQPFTQPILAAHQIQLHQLLVKESILSHHGNLVNDDKQGEFAVSLLKLAQDGSLMLRYDPEGRISSLLFESPRLPAVR